jgi:hypothetical protein
MSQQPSIILFSVVFGIVTMLIDVYVLYAWMRHVRSRAFSHWLYRVPWIIAGVVGVVYWYVVYRRHFFRMDGFDVTLFGMVSLWYLPKLGILPFVVIRDAIAGIRKLATRRQSSEPAPPPVDVSTSRRAFLGTTTWSMAAIPYVMVGQGMFSTLYDFEVTRIPVYLPRLPKAFDGFRIVQISDVHAGSFPDHRPFEEVRRIIDTLKPDMVVVTGDWVNMQPQEMAVIAREVQKLRAPYGVRAVLGNHDHYHTPEDHDRLISTIRGLDVDLLINEHRRITVGSETLILAGTDNTGFKQNFARLDQALAGVVGDEATILLAHDPTFWDMHVVGKQPIDLMLSGHTHGGQFGVQVLGVDWSPAQYIYKQWAGLYRTGEQQLYVNRGVGTVGPPLRIGIRPEITHFTLHSVGAFDHLA